MSPSRGKRLRLRSSSVFRAIDENEGALLDAQSWSFFATNPTALFILELLQRGSTRDEIVTAVCRRFDTTPEQCGPDLERFLEQLRTARLVEET